MKRLIAARDWLVMHFKIILGRPTNGHSAMREMDEYLALIKENKRTIREVVGKIEEQTNGLKEIAESNGGKNAGHTIHN